MPPQKLDVHETNAKRGTMTTLQTVRREASCACCSDLLNGKFDRRHFVQAVAVGAATFGLVPYIALAAEGNYEAMVLSCIDPRMQEPVHKDTVEQNLTGKFSQFVIAGARVPPGDRRPNHRHTGLRHHLATQIHSDLTTRV